MTSTSDNAKDALDSVKIANAMQDAAIVAGASSYGIANGLTVALVHLLKGWCGRDKIAQDQLLKDLVDNAKRQLRTDGYRQGG